MEGKQQRRITPRVFEVREADSNQTFTSKGIVGILCTFFLLDLPAGSFLSLPVQPEITYTLMQSKVIVRVCARACACVRACVPALLASVDLHKLAVSSPVLYFLMFFLKRLCRSLALSLPLQSGLNRMHLRFKPDDTDVPDVCR